MTRGGTKPTSKRRLVSLSKRSYGKVPKFSDARKVRCNLLKIQIKRPNFWVFCQKDANGIANSEDSDQPQSDLGLHCLPRHICPKTLDLYGNV